MYSGNIPRRLRTDEDLIEYCIKKNILRDYAVYLKIRLLHANGVMYNYSPIALSNLIDLSDQTARRSIAALLRHGFVDIQRVTRKNRVRKNLRLLSTNKVIRRNCPEQRYVHRCTIIARPENSIETIVDLLINKLLQKFSREAMYAERNKVLSNIAEQRKNRPIMGFSPTVKGGMSSFPVVLRKKQKHDELVFNEAERKRLGLDCEKASTKYVSPQRGARLISEYENNFIIGYRQLAEKLGYSHSYVWQVVKRLKGMGLVTTLTVDVMLRQMSFEDYLNERAEMLGSYQGYLYHSKGHVYTCLGTILNFTDFPVKNLSSRIDTEEAVAAPVKKEKRGKRYYSKY
jgi:DNA-binding MarR family transcriptional regulator